MPGGFKNGTFQVPVHINNGKFSVPGHVRIGKHVLAGGVNLKALSHLDVLASICRHMKMYVKRWRTLNY